MGKRANPALDTYLEELTPRLRHRGLPSWLVDEVVIDVRRRMSDSDDPAAVLGSAEEYAGTIGRRPWPSRVGTMIAVSTALVSCWLVVTSVSALSGAGDVAVTAKLVVFIVGAIAVLPLGLRAMIAQAAGRWPWWVPPALLTVGMLAVVALIRAVPERPLFSLPAWPVFVAGVVGFGTVVAIGGARLRRSGG